MREHGDSATTLVESHDQFRATYCDDHTEAILILTDEIRRETDFLSNKVFSIHVSYYTLESGKVNRKNSL
jgi:hypothetical protein